MKRIVLISFAIFTCAIAVADTITINWYTDNQTSTTTTCEIGSDVLLPNTPTKRGYVFKGWKKDSFNRGTWTDWNAVPSNTNLYPIDTHNNKIPKENDYMIISDAGLYPVDAIIVEKAGEVQSSANVPIKCTVNGTETTVLYSRDSEVHICGGKVKISCFYSNYFSFYANTDMYYNGNLLHNSDLIAQQHWAYGLKFVVSLTKISGTWRFIYHGNWEVDGKYGWKPVEQIVSE